MVQEISNAVKEFQRFGDYPTIESRKHFPAMSHINVKLNSDILQFPQLRHSVGYTIWGAQGGTMKGFAFCNLTPCRP
jgi:hypothetical protein